MRTRGRSRVASLPEPDDESSSETDDSDEEESPDSDSSSDRLVFNRTVGLRDTWAKLEQKSP